MNEMGSKTFDCRANCAAQRSPSQTFLPPHPCNLFIKIHYPLGCEPSISWPHLAICIFVYILRKGKLLATFAHNLHANWVRHKQLQEQFAAGKTMRIA